ncbi:MAG TPA: PIN domain-containing protein [Anaerolineales bacterium]|nr:PIN domain-containing protein [Anaerolineales bacterium]
MIKVFLDSNIWLRPLVEESPASTSVIDLFHLIEAGKIKPYTSTIVLIEVAFVLHSVYKISHQDIKKDLFSILETKNLTLIELTNFPQALELHARAGVKLTDCLITTQLPSQTTFISFDQEFKKISTINLKSPREFITQIDL